MGTDRLPALSTGPRVLVPEVVWPRRRAPVAVAISMPELVYSPPAGVPIRGLFVDLYA
jgi:hypothetical protein